MTYKGTNWTRGELGNVPDENPVIECERCGHSHAWKQWQEWYDFTPETDFLCPGCRTQKRRLERRRENNRELARWA